ncbi:CRISPR-associated RAMP Cmr1 [Geitlerinema sp. FC II]|nr:CRISPR-associated RAMP Cmr1 [Geitlerinema sp. FC II]
MEITIKTLTPLWTGGVETGKCDRIHETGLLGSLRWWMEVLVRGVGGHVCDPTGEGDRNGFDAKKFDAKQYRELHNEIERRQYLHKAGLCDVSQIFGATGWKRKFRLSVDDIQEISNWQRQSLKITPQGRTRGWFLNPGWLGTFTLSLQGNSETLSKLYLLLRFMEAYGSLGARPQLGYGTFYIVDVKNLPETRTTNFFPDKEPIGKFPEFPDLQTFTFFKLRFTPRKPTWWQTVPGIRELRGKRDSWTELEQLAKNGTIPTTPALKNYIRYGHHWSSPTIPHWLFGTIRREEKLRSKVTFSWAYRVQNTDEWEIRGWMYLPQDRNGRAFRRKIVRVFQDKLGKPQNWLKALGLDPTDYSTHKLTLFPEQNPWQIHPISETQAFLEKTLQESDRDY